MAITVRRFRRAEAWSNWKAAGGTRTAVIDDALSLNATAALENEQLILSVPLDSAAAPYLGARKIIRVDQDDATFDEYRIIDRATDDDASRLVITANPFRLTDLQGAALISRKDSDNVVVYDFEVLGLTASEIVANWVLPALAAAGFTWVAAGTITPTARLDMTFAWDTPLAVLLRIATATQSEIDIRKNGTTGYFIDIVTKVNSGAQQADLRVDKNLINVTRAESATEQATRVVPRGSDMGDGMRATMARATWQVSSVAGLIIGLADPAGGKGPVQFDNQLNGLSLRTASGPQTGITSSSASAQTVTVASATGISVGDLVQFRDGSAADLTYLDSPADIAAYGIKLGMRDVPDVPATNNLVKNAAMRVWPGGAGSLPTNWTAVGVPTIAKQTAAPFTAIGGQSIKVTSTADGQGVISDAVAIFPTALNPYLSGYAKLWVASGNARVELVINTPSGAKIFPMTPNIAAPTSLGQWFDVGAAGYDANGVAATTAQIRIVQNGTAGSVFYIDAAQLTQSATQQPWFEGSGGTRLWQEANEALRIGASPLVSYTVPLVDLESIDPVVWNESALILGANARVVDARLGIDIITRIVEVSRDYLNPQGVSVTLSNRFDDLTDILAAAGRPDRVSPSTPSATGDTAATVERPIAIVDFDSIGHPQVNLIGGTGTVSMKVEVSNSGAPTDAAVEATTAIENSVSLISYSSPIIAPGGLLYVRAFGYSGPTGTGTRSPGLDVVAKRQGSGAPEPPTASVTQSAITAPTLTTETVTLDGALGAGGSTLQWRTRTLNSNQTPGAWGAFSASPALPQELAVTRALKWTKTVEIQTKDSTGAIAHAEYVVASKMDALTDNGIVDDQQNMSSGAKPFRRIIDLADQVVEMTGRWFTDNGMLDASRRIINVYRSAVSEPVGNLFKRGVNTLVDVLDDGSYRKTSVNYVDSSNRPWKLNRNTAGDDISAETLGATIGSDIENMVLNGGGQDGALGSQAPNWTFGTGQALVPAADASKFGDRSLKIHHASLTRSYSSQDFSVVDGGVYEVAGWLKANYSAGGTGSGVVIAFGNSAGLTGYLIIEKVTGFEPDSTRPDIGMPIGTNFDFTFLRCTFKAIGTGTLTMYIDFGYSGTILGDIWADGVNLRRVMQKPNEGGYRGFNALDSNHRIIDQRHINQVSAGNRQSFQTSSPLTAADVGTSATISIAAHTNAYGFGSVSYNSGSVTGLLFGTKYYIYADDPTFAGGSVTYQATLDDYTLVGSSGRYYVGVITTPNDGGGGTGGGGGGGCVAEEMWLTPSLRADAARPGDELDLYIGEGVTELDIIHATYRTRVRNCVEIVAECGARLVLSADTRVTLETGAEIIVTRLQPADRLPVLHPDGSLRWESMRVAFAGARAVVPINVGNGTFAAAAERDGPRIFTHNTKAL